VIEAVWSDRGNNNLTMKERGNIFENFALPLAKNVDPY
jgi:hypothetical protein